MFRDSATSMTNTSPSPASPSGDRAADYRRVHGVPPAKTMGTGMRRWRATTETAVDATSNPRIVSKLLISAPRDLGRFGRQRGARLAHVRGSSGRRSCSG